MAAMCYVYPTLLPRPMAELHRGSKLSHELIESLVFAFQLAIQTLGHMQEHFRDRATNFLIPYNGLGQVCVRFKKINPTCA